MTEARSAALPACSDGFDDVDGGPECGVYIQMRGVEQVRVSGWFEGGGGAGRIALVAAPDVGQHVRLVDPGPALLQLARAAAGTHLGGCSDEDFHVGVGEDDRPDVTPVEDRAGELRPKSR